MSADKHRGLARRTAYLRLAASRGDTGFAVQIKWGYAITPDVMSLEEAGCLRRSRNFAGGRKRVTCMVHHPERTGGPPDHSRPPRPGHRARFTDPDRRPAESPQRREAQSHQ
jgi:hypothetical protein